MLQNRFYCPRQASGKYIEPIPEIIDTAALPMLDIYIVQGTMVLWANTSNNLVFLTVSSGRVIASRQFFIISHKYNLDVAK